MAGKKDDLGDKLIKTVVAIEARNRLLGIEKANQAVASEVRALRSELAQAEAGKQRRRRAQFVKEVNEARSTRDVGSFRCDLIDLCELDRDYGIRFRVTGLKEEEEKRAMVFALAQTMSRVASATEPFVAFCMDYDADDESYVQIQGDQVTVHLMRLEPEDDSEYQVMLAVAAGTMNELEREFASTPGLITTWLANQKAKHEEFEQRDREYAEARAASEAKSARTKKWIGGIAAGLALTLGGLSQSGTVRCQWGEAASCAAMGASALNAGKNGEAETLLRRACEGGMPKACESAAMLSYQAGKATPEGVEKVLGLPCEQGVPNSCHNLGAIYNLEYGKTKNVTFLNRAVQLLTRACSLGFDDDCLLLGNESEKVKDPTAFKFYDTACKNGYQDGCKAKNELALNWDPRMCSVRLGYINDIQTGVVSKVRDRSPAMDSGLRVGDQMITVAGRPFSEWKIDAAVEGSPVSIEIQRDGQKAVMSLVPRKLCEEKPAP